MTIAPRRSSAPLALTLVVLLSACAGTATRLPSAESELAGAPPGAGASAQAATAAPADTDAPAATAAVGTPVDALEPEVEVDLNAAAAQADLWQRVRRGFTMPELDNPLVHEREAWYAARPDHVQRMTERGSRYLFHIVQEIEKRGLPSELALLPFIESAFNPEALSIAKASGMWQFMPATGRDFELRQNIFRDDRRDVLASTRAALDYLTRLHDQFGDWHLALAAYNWGEGNVQRAIERNQKAGLPTDYESLRMPAETRLYVPKLQAVKNIVARPAEFAITLPELANHPYFLGVPVERDIDVELAARLAGMKLADFRALNPQLNKPVILAAGTPQVLLPYDNASAFVNNLGGHGGPLASWTAWTAPKTLSTAEAARRVGMSEARLCEVNRIPPRMLVKAGSTLLVPRSAELEADVSEHVADNATMLLAPEAPPLRRLAFHAGRKGDTVAAVAKRYGLSAAKVAQWNKVGLASRFSAGTSVVVYLPTAAQPVRTASAAGPTRGMGKGPSKSKRRSVVVAGQQAAGKTDRPTASGTQQLKLAQTREATSRR